MDAAVASVQRLQSVRLDFKTLILLCSPFSTFYCFLCVLLPPCMQPDPCFGFGASLSPRFPCLCIIFCIFALFSAPLHYFPHLCIVFCAFTLFSAYLHCFPCLASFSVPCIVFRISHCFPHPLCFVACMSFALPGFPCSFVLSPASALGL